MLKRTVSTFIVGSLLIFSNGLSLASTVNVSGGNYYNNPGGNTTFSNNGGVLQVQSGQTVRGLENGTNNGGHLIFNANTVRVDGVIDVSALKSGNIYMGNGGRVDVNANIFLHNGAIYANGTNGGFVNINVGSMMMGPNARIEANGQTGYAGQVKINAQDGFDMPQGAVITANGIPIENLDTKNIEVMASIVNMDGLLQANGVSSNGGKIILVATGQSCNVPAEGNGNVNIGPNGLVQANGSSFSTGEEGESSVGNGGSITIKASNIVNLSGILEAKGGNGGEYQDGTISVFDHTETVQTGTEQVQVGTEQVQVGTEQVQTGTETVQDGTQTITENHTDNGSVNLGQTTPGVWGTEVLHTQTPDVTVQNNKTLTFTLPGQTASASGGTATLPDLNVIVNMNGNKVIVTIKDLGGNTLYTKTLKDSADANWQSMTFDIQFTNAHGTDSTVSITRQFHVNTDIAHNGKSADVDFYFKPFAIGNNYSIDYTTSTEVPVYKEVPVYEERPIFEERPVYEERPIYEEKPVYRDIPNIVSVDGGNGGLITIKSTNANDVNVPEESVSGGTPNGDSGKVCLIETRPTPPPICHDCPPPPPPPTCEGEQCNPEEPPVTPESPTPPIEPPVKPVEAPKFDPGALLFPYIQEGEIRGGSIVIIGFDNEEMFFNPTYQATLQEILNLAHKTYQEQRANGATDDEAFTTVHDVLIIEGFTKNVVTRLLPTLGNNDRDTFLKKEFEAILSSDNFDKGDLFKNLKVKRWVIKVPVFLNRFGGYRYWNESQI